MPDLIDLIAGQLDDATLERLGSSLGFDTDTTERAVGTALPVLIGGLARNADASPDARRSLDAALERDHDGSVLEQFGALLGGGRQGGGPLGALLGGSGGSAGGGLADALGGLLGGDRPAAAPRSLDGDGILRHILGDRREAVADGVGRSAGIDGARAAQLLSALAPLVMGALGRAKRERGLDADGLGQLLQRERSAIEERTPRMQQGGLMDLLDSNRDGKIGLADDVAKVGMALGAAFLAGRRKRE